MAQQIFEHDVSCAQLQEIRNRFKCTKDLHCYLTDHCKCPNRSYRFIFMDIQMPVMDGLIFMDCSMPIMDGYESNNFLNI